MACENQISSEDLENAKSDAITIAEVATSREGGVSAGAAITQSTNRFGETTDTLQGRLDKLGIIYDDPIRNYSASLLVSDLRAHRYPADTGEVYIPTAPLPFTTGASFDTSKWTLYTSLAAPSNITGKAIIFIPIGQSNSTRWSPRVSQFSTPAQLYTFNGGSQKDDDTAGQINKLFPVNESDMESLVPYNENNEDKEGLAPGFSSRVINSLCERVYTWTSAQGSRHWREMRPSRSTWNAFCQSIAQLTKLSNADGYTDIKYVFHLDHGESEADDLAPEGLATDTPVTKEQYIQLLSNWNESISSYLGYITDSSTPNYSIMLAPINFSGNLSYPTFSYREIQQAQLEYSLSSPNTFMIGGKSQLDVETDNVHITGLAKRYYAELSADRYINSELSGSWEPLYMVSASRVGTSVSVTCNKDIEIDAGIVDTSSFYPGSKYGLTFEDNTGFITINSVSASGRTMTIELDSTPSGADELIRCAQNRPSGATSTSDFKPRTSIKSLRQGLVSKFDNEVLYDFMVPNYVQVN